MPLIFKDAIMEAKENNEGGLRIVGIGMNEAELEYNPVLKERVVKDLNKDPVIDEPLSPLRSWLSSTVCVVSIDYLTQPREVLASILKQTIPGCWVHLVISNRCFPTKAIARWLTISEEERLQMVGDYLWFSGWKDIEIVELSNGREEKPVEGLLGKMGMMGRVDPLWVVRGRKPATEDSSGIKDEL